MKLADVVFAAILMNLLSSRASAGATCESLASLSLPDTTITVAQTVAAGALRLPTALPDAGPHGGITFVAAKDLPEFCRVVGVAKPSKDSEIKFEVWMPTSNWNGDFMGLGNGGMGGSISYGSMRMIGRTVEVELCHASFFLLACVSLRSRLAQLLPK